MPDGDASPLTRIDDLFSAFGDDEPPTPQHIRNELGKIRREVSDLEFDKGEVDKQAAALEKEIAPLRAEKDELQTMYQAALNKLREMKEAYSKELAATCEEHRKEVSAIQQRHEFQMQAKNTELQAVNADLKKALGGSKKKQEPRDEIQNRILKALPLPGAKPIWASEVAVIANLNERDVFAELMTLSDDALAQRHPNFRGGDGWLSTDSAVQYLYQLRKRTGERAKRYADLEGVEETLLIHIDHTNVRDVHGCGMALTPETMLGMQAATQLDSFRVLSALNVLSGRKLIEPVTDYGVQLLRVTPHGIEYLNERTGR